MRTAVLRAFLEELAEVGYPAVSFESVARRAGVHKTTLYRRWIDVEGLLLDAALQFSSTTVWVPDSGSLADDLMSLARAIAINLRSPTARAMLRAVVAEADNNPAVADAARAYWRTRFELVGETVQRAVERGEIPLSTDPQLLIEATIGPLYLRTLVTQEPVDDEYVDAVVALAVASVGANGSGLTSVAE